MGKLISNPAELHRSPKSPTLRIMQQIKDEMDIEHVSFLGLFKERLSAAGNFLLPRDPVFAAFESMPGRCNRG